MVVPKIMETYMHVQTGNNNNMRNPFPICYTTGLHIKWNDSMCRPSGMYMYMKVATGSPGTKNNVLDTACSLVSTLQMRCILGYILCTDIVIINCLATFCKGKRAFFGVDTTG